jgi:cold shock CspA family protein/ribosome-associated translation inhibitor RaiA
MTMEIPAEVAFEHVDHSDAVESRVRREFAKLEQFQGRLTSARAVISRPQRRHLKGDIYEVRIQLGLPGAADVVVSLKPGNVHAHTDVCVAIRDAFQAARRQLKDISDIRSNIVKTHEEPPHGVIAEIVADPGHGMIESGDGRAIYFHRNAVADDKFDELEVGMAVRFSEDRGDKGPQATFVKPLGGNGARWPRPVLFEQPGEPAATELRECHGHFRSAGAVQLCT